MNEIEVLCATVGQNDFSLVKKMNISSNMLIANQNGKTEYREIVKNGKKIRMITTNTKGGSVNRNLALIYAERDICLLADDDVVYDNDYEDIIKRNFKNNPSADMIIFNVRTDSEERPIRAIKKSRIMWKTDRNPFGAVRVAFRLSSQRKFNCWFSLILGPNSIYRMGEDSKFIEDFRREGIVYLSKDYIGTVSFDKSSWFEGYNEEYFYNKGAFLRFINRDNWMYFMYYAYTIKSDISLYRKFFLMYIGAKEASLLKSYNDYLKEE